MADHQSSAKIIIINQNKNIYQLAEILRNRSFSVKTVSTDSDEFINLEELDPDIFIVEVNSHDFDAAEICRKIRRCSKMPILVLSIVDQPGMVEYILDAGADEFTVKPAPTSILIARIKTLARRARAEKAALLMQKVSGERITI